MNFDDKAIVQNLNTKIFGRRVFFFKSIKSTMDYARKLAEMGEDEGALVVADFQTKGRGRFGRIWKAEPGKNILISIILRPKIPLEKFGMLSFLTANAVATAVESISSLKIQTKWPNDLLINDKKFCGILIEASITAEENDFVIAGIGINVNQSDFPKEIKEFATSLLIETGKTFDRITLLNEILKEFELEYIELHEKRNFSVVIDKWKKRCHIFGKKIKVLQAGKEISGVALDVDLDGRLIIKTDDGYLLKFSSGDVTIVK